MIRFVSILVAILLFCVADLAAQSSDTTEDKKAIKYYEQSALQIRGRDFNGGIELLEKALLRDPAFIEAHLRLASAYKVLLRYDLAETQYREALAVDSLSKLNFDTYFALGLMIYDKGEYKEARKYLSRYIQTNPANAGREGLAADLIKNIDFALDLMSKPLPFNPEPLPAPLNKYVMQYFPAVTADGKQLFFTVRKGNTANDDEDIYVTRQNDDGAWSEPEPISDLINSHRNEGTSSVSADGRMLIFTSCQAPGGFGSCDLYFVQKEGDTWGKPQNIGQPINSSGWESQPSLSADGRTLYFVSDRKGGQGKRDIWVSTLSARDNWMEPVNLGPVINTEGDDLSPFIHVNGQSLYFSSSGHMGLGKYDLFLSEKNGLEWSQPKNLGYPINTKDDQVSLVITSDGSKAYYSHEVIGNNRDFQSSLYTFDVPEEIRVQNKSNFLTGRVMDIETKKPLGASIEMFDINDASLNYKVTSDKVDGKYFVVLTEGKEYSIYVTRKGYLFENLTFNYLEKKSREPEVLDIYLTPIKAGATSVLKNIFFDVDQYVLKEKSKTELDEVIKFLKDNEQIRMEIEGHTDNTGSTSHNLELSTNRAKSVYDFLIKAGIPKERLQYKGYGSTKPKVDNSTEEGKQLNRRIEFRIL